MVTASKTISIPNEDLSDDTTLSVARKFLNEVKSYLVTLQLVVKQKMTLEIHNWSSFAHKEVHRIISHEIDPIINQVDARVQNFDIQFLQEAAKFIQDFKSLAKEADESLDKQKSLEMEIERLLKASVERLQAQLRDLKGKSTDTPSASNTLDLLNKKIELKIVELEFQVSWLSHQRLSHLNFNTINDLAKNDLVSGLPKFKYAKEHLFPFCEQGKSKRALHPSKSVLNSKQRLHLLHMDLCGPIRVASINDFYPFSTPVIIVRTDNGTEFKNHVLKEYFDSVGITHETSAVKTPQENGVVERKNRMLVEAARTMLIFSHASLFLWAEAIATACYIQNRSIIYRRFNKTPYELIQGRKPDISYLHVFRALCYPKNDRKDISKLGVKGDIGFFNGYSANSVSYRVYNRRTKKIIETMNVMFDELSAMDFEQNSLRPGFQCMTFGEISSELELTYAPSTFTPQRPSKRNLDILFEPLHNEYLGGRPAVTPRAIHDAPVLQNLQAPTTSVTPLFVKKTSRHNLGVISKHSQRNIKS
uniref:Integrase catalytic domain-containing protein n=1 Tax=Tanacetum cinerariifolium TaxID=118510 RepID=A0A699J083_TANCI|nr:hypothetical protein [Tanacetum cinerariifolium]